MHFLHSGARISLRVFENNTNIIKLWLFYSWRVRLMARHTLGFEKILKYCDITPFKAPLHSVHLRAMYFFCRD